MHNMRAVDSREDTTEFSVADARAAGQPLPGRSWRRGILENVVPPVVAFVVLIVVWLLWLRVTGISRWSAPSPGDIANGFRGNWADLLTAAWSTFQDAMVGFALAVVVGIFVATIMAQSRILERAIYPYATLAQTIPIYAVAPIFGYLLPGDHPPIVVVSFIIAVFPVIANATLGLASVDSTYVSLFEMYNASRIQQLLYLRLPFALPNILTGVRVSSGLAIVGATVAEMLLGAGDPAGGGLGYEIAFAAPQGQWDLLGAAAVASGLLGIAVFAIVSAMSSLALRHWHESALEVET
jgi:NitT/TauT family transport system permease protein